MCESREKTQTRRKDERASEERLWTRVKFCPCRTRAPTLLWVQDESPHPAGGAVCSQFSPSAHLFTPEILLKHLLCVTYCANHASGP